MRAKSKGESKVTKSLNHQIVQWIEGCRNGRRLDQRNLYEFLYPGMMSVCFRYVKNTDEAADIYNRAMLKVFNALEDGKADNVKNFEGWVYRIVVNASIDHLRSEMRFKYHAEPSELLISDHANDVLSQLAAEELLGLIQQLTPAYRTIFNLYVIDGYTHKEIAEMLDIAEGTSKSNLAKARKKLQAFIHNQPTKEVVYG